MKLKKFYLFFVIYSLFNSCATKKEIHYLQDVKESYDGVKVNYNSPFIQPNDILSVKISAIDTELAAPFNKQSGQNGGGQMLNLNLLGYLVSNDYYISLPILGNINTFNKTTKTLELKIIEELKNGGHLSSPTVEVVILNSRFKILGEVGSPGVYNFSESTITILEAIALAGDLTINGVREKIKVIRNENGIQTVGLIDITSGDIINSPYYNIKQNDVIIIDQNGPKVKSAGFIGNLGTAISVGSILLTTILLITRN